MKYEAILAAEEYLARDTRIDITYGCERPNAKVGRDQCSRSSTCRATASACASRNPLQVGWEVTLKSGKHDPVKAIICWGCRHESGGVFSEPVAL